MTKSIPSPTAASKANNRALPPRSRPRGSTQPHAGKGAVRANSSDVGASSSQALANIAGNLTAEAGNAPALRNLSTYARQDFGDCTWVCTEDFIAENWGPYGLKETPQGTLATTLPALGACHAISIIIDKPLCEGCDQPITDGCCHNCEVVFHRDQEPSDEHVEGWLKAERSLGLGEAA